MFVFLPIPMAWPQEPGLGFPIFLGQTSTMIPPALDGGGRSVVFGSAITADGASLPTMDIYVVSSEGSGLRRLTRLTGTNRPPQGALSVSLSSDGRWAAFTALGTAERGEEVHLLDVAGAVDRTLAVDTQGCIQPLLAIDCPACFFSCVQTPHVTGDGSAVFYAVRRQRPFYVARNDGAPPRNLPIFFGILASAPQRILSRNGQVVFTSNAPFGPTFAAAPTDVYLTNLDGTDVRQVTKFADSNIFARDATISTDGSTIAFLANLDAAAGRATNTTQLFTIRADGTQLRQIASGENTLASPSINGDGSRVAFILGRDVSLAASDGTGVQRLTRLQFSVAGNSVLSENGRRVAVTLGPTSDSLRGSSIGAIYTVNSDGSSLAAAYAPRSLNQNGITGAAMPFGVVAAGSLASAFGLNFTRDTFAYATNLPLPESLSGVSLTMNGIPLPLLSVGPWQINAQIPPDANEAPAAFEVRFQDGARTAPIAQEIKAFGPAIFLLPSPGFNRGAVFHAGTATPVDPEHPAQAGEILEIYASGLGPTSPFVPPGTPAPASPPAVTQARPQATIGRLPARVLFSGLAPGFVGLYQVNMEVPAGAPPGNAVPLVLSIAGMNSNPVSIAVR
ncbi:MAG: hypothetical protein A3J28_05350 [Acidobacteria bacterium RIFCSPLOWO2_12_FULL_60_22]|nr:MAG: hypothetical protein A3J28_05350 [Acidobacteria bacterium RIFCSPLOWO2_12_FULL_60_22]